MSYNVRILAQCNPNDDCFNNLIQNSGFESNCNPLPAETFYEDPFSPQSGFCVNNWEKTQGTPHLYSLPGILNTNITNGNFIAGLYGHGYTQNIACGRESFTQLLNLNLVSGQSYNLRFQARSSGPGNDLNPIQPQPAFMRYNIKIGNQVSTNLNFDCSTNPINGTSATLLTETINSSLWLNRTICNFVPNQNYSNILIELDPLNSHNGVVWFDNFELWCESNMTLSLNQSSNSWNSYNFTASASGSGLSVSQWHWDFGDGTTSNVQNPTKTFQYPGTHNVCLCITDNRGCTKKSCIQLPVYDETACNCPSGNGNLNIGSFTTNTNITSSGIGNVGYYNNTGKCLSVKGTVFVNRSLRIDGGEIRMHPGAQMIVFSPYIFQLNSINENGGIHGCENMWKTISAWEGSKLELRDCDISDGEHAIEARNHSTVILNGDNFSNNHTGLYAFEPFGSNLTADVNIQQTIFTSTPNSLLPQYGGQIDVPGTRGYSGITSNNFALLNLGACDFRCENLTNGVVGLNSYLIIGNKIKIKDMKSSFNNSSIQGCGFYLQSKVNSLGYTPGIYSPYQGTGYLTDVEDCKTGIYADGAQIFAERWVLDEMDKGINFINPRQRTLKSRNNIFTKIRDRGIYVRFESSGSNEIDLHENQITIGGTNVTTASTTFGIHLHNIKGLTANSATLFKNDPINLKPAAAYIFSSVGIFNQGLNNTDMIENYIEAFNNAGTGINITNVQGGKIECNKAIGYSNASALAGLRYGMLISGSNTTNYSCNSIDNFANGLWISGFNLLTNRLSTTQIKDHYIGLKYDNAMATTGDQTFTDNHWLSSSPSGGLQALHLGGTNAASSSKFKVSTNSGYNPSPVNPSSGWFTDFTHTPATCSSCDTTSPGIIFDRLDSLVYSGSFDSIDGFPATQWVAERELYKKILNHPGLLTTNQLAYNFYNSRTNMTVGLTERIHYLMERSAHLSTPLQQIVEYSTDRVRFWSDSLIAIDKELQTATGSDSIQLLAERLLAKDSIFTHQLLQTEILDSIDVQITSSIDAAKNLLDQITPAEAWESAEYFVLQTLLNRDLSNLSELVKDSMQYIALACVGELGQAVYEARAIVDTMIIGSSCPLPGSGHRIGKTKEISKWKVGPNPSVTGLFYLSGGELNKDLEIKMYNINGSIVEFKTLNQFNDGVWIDLNNQPNGIYFLKLKNTKDYETIKVIKQ